MGVQDWLAQRRRRRLARQIVEQLSSRDAVQRVPAAPEPAEQSEADRDLALFLERERLYESRDAIEKGSSVDAEYARVLKERLGRLPDGDRYAIREITVLGELENGEIAWVSDDGLCVGHTPVGFFQTEAVSAGQRFRVRLFSYLWGHRLEALLDPIERGIDLDQLRDQLAANRTGVAAGIKPDELPMADSAVVAPRVPVAPESVSEPWMRQLKTGDIVYVRVPFDDGIDRRGRTSKPRPAVFIRWEADYGVVRPYYKKDGYLDQRSRGTRIGGPKKDGIVRNSSIDVYPKDILRRIGQLDDEDLAMLGLGNKKRVVPGGAASGLDFTKVPKPSEYTDALNRVIDDAKSFAWPGYESDALLVLFMRSMRHDPQLQQILIHHAIPYSAAGDAYRRLCDQLGVVLTGKKFGTRLTDALFDVNRNERFVYETRHDPAQLPWLVLVDTRNGAESDFA